MADTKTTKAGDDTLERIRERAQKFATAHEWWSDGPKVIDDLAAFAEAELAAERDFQPIETAPKDGRHILAADFSGRGVGFGGNPQQSYQCVVHWWQWGDGTHQEEWGWYPSTGAGESNALTNLTHWKPLEELAQKGSEE